MTASTPSDDHPADHGAEPPTLVVRCPEDLLALVPLMLGFVPSDSVAMLTFGGDQEFHARVDLPHEPNELPDVVDSLLEPAQRHRVRQVAFVVYTDSEFVGRRLGSALRHDFERAGITVIEIIRAEEARWFPLLRRGSAPEWGVPYDLSAHPFVAESVFRGRVTHPSREAMAQTLRPDVDAQRATSARVAALGPRWLPHDPPPLPVLLREGDWVEGLVLEHIDAGTVPGEPEMARLLRSIQVLPVRDAAWGAIDPAAADSHVALWTAVCRATPHELLAPAASLLGWAAWQAGHGALAWCAHDLAVAADPEYTMAGYLGQVLEHALPPSVWSGEWRWGAEMRDVD